MIYFDAGATTLEKPAAVGRAMAQATHAMSSPGRGSYPASRRAEETAYLCRQEAAELLGVPQPENVIITTSATHGLNIAIRSLLGSGDRVVISGYEHNAVTRPLHAIPGLSVTVIDTPLFRPDLAAEEFRRAIRQLRPRAVVCTHVSNVWGIRLPVARIAAMAHLYGVPVCVDAAQSAGILPVFLEEDGVDYLCAAPHKGLYAPMGTGLLVTARGGELDTILEGGTGTNSVSLEQPEEMPERLESGTINVPGIAGLRAGLAFVRQKGTERILRHEVDVMRQIYRALHRTEGVELFTGEPDGETFAPVVSFRVRGDASEQTAAALTAQGVAVRAGLHCAPSAHAFMGTLESGTVRVCPSAFTTGRDVQGFVTALRQAVRNSQAVHKEKL